MNKEYPLVTIITPTYNRADLVEETILSVIEQDYPNIEYIVLDDGSEDNTVELLKQYEDRLIWSTHPNMGHTRTVNKGFGMAKGEIIGIVNSDDPLLPGAIRKIVSFLVANPEVMVAYPDWDQIDENGAVFEHIETFEYSYVDMIRWHRCIPGPGALFRREVVEACGGWNTDLNYIYDYEFWLKAGLLGPFMRVPDTLATFRWHSASISASQRGIEMAEEHIYLADLIYSLPNLPPEVLKVKNEAYSSAIYTAGLVAGEDNSVRKKYFLRALHYAPLKYFGEYQYRLKIMIPYFFNRKMSSLFFRMIALRKKVIQKIFRKNQKNA